MTAPDVAPESEALIYAEQPWADAWLAELYDAFPFSDDLPFYRRLAREQGARVLELCCGTGRLLVPLAEPGREIVGLDASEAMLRIAQRKLEQAGPSAAGRARLVRGDVRDFDLGEPFDLAIVA